MDNGYSDLVEYIITNINTSSSMYQMFGTIGDICYINTTERQCLYYKDVPVRNFNRTLTGENIVCFVITLEYGQLKLLNMIDHGTIPNLKQNLTTTIGIENMGQLLHPVIRVFNKDNKLLDVIHFNEDLYAEFKRQDHYADRIIRLFKSYID